MKSFTHITTGFVRTIASAGMGMVLLLVVGPACAQIETDIASRYPEGSIQSIESATQALAEVAKERARVEEEVIQREIPCYDKFFTFACLHAVKEERRVALKALRSVEIAASYQKRFLQAQERDQALQERHGKNITGNAAQVYQGGQQ